MQPMLERVNTLYGLKLRSTEKVTKGFLSENYVLTDDSAKYFLKRYRFDSKERVEEVHLVKKYFAERGIPVILPIAHKEGKTFFLFDDGYFALFPFVSDKQLDRGSLNDTAIVSLGETLGKMHLLGKDTHLEIKEKFKPWDKEAALEKIKKIRSKINGNSPFDSLALESIETKQRLIESNSLTYADLNLPSDHLIHGDYLDHNVFFGADDKMSHVFDFEKTDRSPRVYELYRSLMYGFVNGNVSDEDIRKIKLYLDSYQSVYPVSTEELSRGLRLFYLKSIHGVWVESEHYLEDNHRVDHFLFSELQRIKYLSKNLESFEEKLLG